MEHYVIAHSHSIFQIATDWMNIDRNQTQTVRQASGEREKTQTNAGKYKWTNFAELLIFLIFYGYHMLWWRCYKPIVLS